MDMDYICRTKMPLAEPEFIQSRDELDGGMFEYRNN